MASHAIFQYNVLVIDDTHNTWTNICVKMIIIGLYVQGMKRYKTSKKSGRKDQDRGNLHSPVKPT